FTGRYGFDSAVKRQLPHAANAAVEVANVDAVFGNIGFLDHDLTGWDGHRRMRHIRLLKTGPGYFVARVVLVGHHVNIVFVSVEAHYGCIHVEELLPLDWRRF